MKKIHKLLIVENPTKEQPDAVEYHYLCNQAVNCDWRGTDLSRKRITCKNCIKMKRKKLKNGYFLEHIEELKKLRTRKVKRK